VDSKSWLREKPTLIVPIFIKSQKRCRIASVLNQDTAMKRANMRRASIVVGIVLLLSAATEICQAASQVVSWGYYWIGKSGIFSPVASPPELPNAIAVAGGAGHSLALQADGTVVGWGDNTFGQITIPMTLNRVVAIAAGDYHSLALRADGTVIAWGDNSSGQTSVPAGLTNVVAISAGFVHSVALRSDGTVIAWGDNGSGQTNVPAGLKNVIAISSRNAYSLALVADGTVVAWGNNYYGQCNVPGDLTNAVTIAAGGEQGVALTADGRLVAWGDNSFGEITTPVGLTNVIKLAAGGIHNLALQDDGTVAAWGAGTTIDVASGGDYGQSIVPSGLTNVAEISAGYIHSLALLRTGPPVLTGPMVNRTVLATSTARFLASANGAQPLKYQWRFNGTNLPGANSALLELTNIQINQAGRYSLVVTNQFGTITSAEMQIAVAPLFITNQPQSQLVLAGQTVSLEADPTGLNPFSFQWYFNGAVLPGATNSTLKLTNVQAQNAGTYAVSVGNPLGVVMSSNATVALTQVKVWGGYFVDTLTNLPINLGNVVALAGGIYQCVALRDDGTVVAWGGDNYYGELNVPSNLTGVTAVSAGDRFNLALKADGTVAGWGWNGYGQITIPHGLSNVVAVAAGYTQSLALRKDGSVVGWGSPAVVPPGISNIVAISASQGFSMGLRADGSVTVWSTSDGSSMYVPPEATNVIAIAAGQVHELALKNDGSVLAWGSDGSPVAVPQNLSNVMAIAAGQHHSLALKNDGTIVAWGDNSLGQCQVPIGLTNVTAIAAGYLHSLALVQAGAPVLRSDLANSVVVYGANAYFHVAAVGAGPLTYQWQCNGTNILNATNSTLEVENVGPNDSGPYSVIVSNSYGSVTTSGASLGVVPFIINQYPTNQYTFRGGAVSLSVAATSQPPLSYQWQFNGADIPDATNSLLTLTNAQLSQAGQYRVVVSNGMGTLASPNVAVEIGQVIVWGDNEFNQLNLPQGLTNIVAVASGDFHNLALRSDGTVVGWGSIGTPAGMTNITAIAAGYNYDLALTADGTVVLWGQNSTALEGSPKGSSNFVAIAAGESHCLALTADGHIVTWGDMSVVPAGLTNVAAIAAGQSHSLALLTNGTVVAWGNNDWGQTNVPPGLTNVVAIAAGFAHSMALRSDGTVTVWGSNHYGQANIPSGLSNVMAISAGGNHCLAMLNDRTVVSWGDSIGQIIPPAYATNLVMVSAGGGQNIAILDSLWPLIIPVRPSRPISDAVQPARKPRGLLDNSVPVTQFFRVFNRSLFTFGAVRVHISNLPPLTWVLNPSGLDLGGNPFVQSSGALTPGASAIIEVGYLTPDELIPNVTIHSDVVFPQAISRYARQMNGDFQLEFAPLNKGNYYIEYSEDLLNWRTAYHGVPSNEVLVKWVDSGPPYSETPPMVQPQRFYRVLLAP
jgi:alpha-tubulin suppressor-like RCC1 family protein